MLPSPPPPPSFPFPLLLPACQADPSFRQLALSLLQRTGSAVEAAAGGEEAVRKVQDSGFDLILIVSLDRDRDSDCGKMKDL